MKYEIDFSANIGFRKVNFNVAPELRPKGSVWVVKLTEANELDSVTKPIVLYRSEIPFDLHSNPGWRPLFWDIGEVAPREMAYALKTLEVQIKAVYITTLRDLMHVQEVKLGMSDKLAPASGGHSRTFADAVLRALRGRAARELHDGLQGLQEHLGGDITQDLGCIADGFSWPHLPVGVRPEDITSCWIVTMEVYHGSYDMHGEGPARSRPASIDRILAVNLRNHMGLDASFVEFGVKEVEPLERHPDGTWVGKAKLIDYDEHVRVIFRLKDAAGC